MAAKDRINAYIVKVFSFRILMKHPRNVGIGLLFILILLPAFFGAGVPQKQKKDRSQDTVYTYQKDVFPLLQANCNPCHFPGGKVYSRMPFDDYKTVASLGKKLNTRLKKQKQQALINRWIELGEKKD